MGELQFGDLDGLRELRRYLDKVGEPLESFDPVSLKNAVEGFDESLIPLVEKINNDAGGPGAFKVGDAIDHLDMLISDLERKFEKKYGPKSGLKPPPVL
jgi:hypothetical protein